MDFIFELIGEFLLGGVIEASSNKKISKWIRYPLVVFVVLFFLSIITCLIFFGFFMINKKSILGGIMMLGVALVMIIGTYISIKRDYFDKKNKND